MGSSDGTGRSRLETLFAIGLLGASLFGLGSVIGRTPVESMDGPDYRDALRIARSEIDALTTLSPEAIAAQLPPGEDVAVIAGSLLEARQRRGAVSIVGRRVAWDGHCSGLHSSPGRACPGLYRRIERITESPDAAAFRVTIVVAWPEPEAPRERPLRRVDLQSRIG